MKRGYRDQIIKLATGKGKVKSLDSDAKESFLMSSRAGLTGVFLQQTVSTGSKREKRPGVQWHH